MTTRYAKSAADERAQTMSYLSQSFWSWANALGADGDEPAFDLDSVMELLAGVVRGDHILDPERHTDIFLLTGELEADPSVYRDAIDTYGESAQRMMLVEECGELLTALAQLSQGVGLVDLEDVAKECADVMIMTVQFSTLLGPELVSKAMREKLVRLREHVDNRRPSASGPPLSECPNCGWLLADYDGVGVLAHEDCGYCSHPTSDEETCPSCQGSGERYMGTVQVDCMTCGGLGNAEYCGICNGLTRQNTRWGGE